MRPRPAQYERPPGEVVCHTTRLQKARAATQDAYASSTMTAGLKGTNGRKRFVMHITSLYYFIF